MELNVAHMCLDEVHGHNSKLWLMFLYGNTLTIKTGHGSSYLGTWKNKSLIWLLSKQDLTGISPKVYYILNGNNIMCVVASSSLYAIVCWGKRLRGAGWGLLICWSRTLWQQCLKWGCCSSCVASWTMSPTHRSKTYSSKMYHKASQEIISAYGHQTPELPTQTFRNSETVDWIFVGLIISCFYGKVRYF